MLQMLVTDVKNKTNLKKNPRPAGRETSLTENPYKNSGTAKFPKNSRTMSDCSTKTVEHKHPDSMRIQGCRFPPPQWGEAPFLGGGSPHLGEAGGTGSPPLREAGET